jgi:hypothetical protein
MIMTVKSSEGHEDAITFMATFVLVPTNRYFPPSIAIGALDSTNSGIFRILEVH